MSLRSFSIRFSRLVFALFLLLATSFPALAASNSADADHVHIELLVPGDKLYSGDELNDAGIYFKLEPGWHIYWKNAGDAGEPPRIHWTLPNGITAGPMQFPAPKRLPLGPLMDFGYEDEVLFPLKLHVANTVKAGPVTLHAKVDWLVCKGSCIPGKAELEVQRNVYVGLLDLGYVPTPKFKQFFDRIPKPLPANFKSVFQVTNEGFRLSINTGQREAEAAFFPEDQNILENPAPQKLTSTANGLILELKKDTSLTANPAQLKGVLELSGGRTFQIAALSGAVAVPAASSFVWSLLLRTAGLAFLGGLLLNLMPCVFPVLFLKGLALVNSGRHERGRLRAHGFVYAAGILVSFWALVAVLLGLRTAGSSLGWGFQFQSPIFLALMAGLLFFLGLSLAGQFEIGLTLTSAGGSLAAKQGYTGSFFTGVLAVVVATPCTAPFMGAAVGYALAQSPVVTFAVFTALALGLAAPYVALTLQPAWTRILPRPGAWMEVLRQAVAVPIFATAIWLAWVLAQAYGANTLALLLVSFLLLAIAGWFLGRWPAKRWSTVIAAAILLAAVALTVCGQRWVDQTWTDHAGNLQVDSAAASVWEPWSPDAVSRYQAAGRPVFVDFTASWCLSCQVNERVALNRPEVQKAFQDASVALLKADWTRRDEAITQTLTALGRSGVPAYALYTPAESSPQLLPEVLTPGVVTDALNKLPKATASQVH
jgi:thiol:disulfide interchange protein DsbD